MSEFSENSHPMLDELHKIQDAIFIGGLGQVLCEDPDSKNRFTGSYIPWEKAIDTYPVSILSVYDSLRKIAMKIDYAPPPYINNPMTVAITDKTRPDVRHVHEVKARVYLNSEEPFTDVKPDEESSVEIREVKVSVTEKGAFLIYPEFLDLGFAMGMYGSNNYQSISRIIFKNTPLKELPKIT